MKVTALALDPIEKKPLATFMPGSKIFSVGSLGCTMKCPWCQNYDIAQPNDPSSVPSREMSAEELVARALNLVPQGNVGIAYTYNEPLLRWREVLECAQLAHDNDLVNVMVTNGMASQRVIEELAPFIDAWNIDLKAGTQKNYDLCNGRLDSVKRTIEIASATSHVEVTTLVIPGYNDSSEELEGIASWIASVDRSIVWHVTRFFGRFKYADRMATPIATLERARAIGEHYLDTVIMGNV